MWPSTVSDGADITQCDLEQPQYWCGHDSMTLNSHSDGADMTQWPGTVTVVLLTSHGVTMNTHTDGTDRWYATSNSVTVSTHTDGMDRCFATSNSVTVNTHSDGTDRHYATSNSLNACPCNPPYRSFWVAECCIRVHSQCMPGVDPAGRSGHLCWPVASRAWCSAQGLPGELCCLQTSKFCLYKTPRPNR